MNRGVVLWVRGEWRQRFVSLALLALLVAVGGGTTVAAIAAARRTDTAFGRLLDETRQPNLSVSALGEQKGLGDLDPALLDRVMQIHGVTGVTELAFVAVAADAYPNFFAIAVTAQRGKARRFISIDGRDVEHIAQLTADEVMVNEAMRDRLDQGAGATVRFRSLAPEQFSASLSHDGVGPPGGPTMIARIVTVGRQAESVSDAPDPFFAQERVVFGDGDANGHTAIVGAIASRDQTYRPLDVKQLDHVRRNQHDRR